MWDFEHPPLNASLSLRYQIDRMSPSECADRLATGHADIGLVPIAALAANPTLRILPGCTIASKGFVRSLLLVHRASQPLTALRSVAADTASRTTLANRFERTGERLIYLDLAHQWHVQTGLPFVSAVWGIACSGALAESIATDLIQSRIHGLQNIDTLVAEWSKKLPIPEQTIRTYLTTNIHYILDEECIEGMRVFFRTAAELGILPEHKLSLS
jgi:chorismate dehydratase